VLTYRRYGLEVRDPWCTLRLNKKKNKKKKKKKKKKEKAAISYLAEGVSSPSMDARGKGRRRWRHLKILVNGPELAFHIVGFDPTVVSYLAGMTIKARSLTLATCCMG